MIFTFTQLKIWKTVFWVTEMILSFLNDNNNFCRILKYEQYKHCKRDVLFFISMEFH